MGKVDYSPCGSNRWPNFAINVIKLWLINAINANNTWLINVRKLLDG